MEGGHRGPTRQGACPGVWACPPPSWPGACPPAVFSVPQILKYSIKNHTKFAGHLEHFYFWDILYCMDNSKNRQVTLFLLYLIYITKSKRRVQKVVPSSFIHLMLIKKESTNKVDQVLLRNSFRITWNRRNFVTPG